VTTSAVADPEITITWRTADFEIGNDLWNSATGEWEGVGFQPPFAEAHAESQEYAAGLVELLRVARDYAQANPALVRPAA
jgi:hypothetical protein